MLHVTIYKNNKEEDLKADIMSGSKSAVVWLHGKKKSVIVKYFFYSLNSFFRMWFGSVTGLTESYACYLLLVFFLYHPIL